MRYLFIISLFFIAGCGINSNSVQVSSFDDCVEAGNAVMESYPRQCRHGDDLFVEEIDNSFCADECGDGVCAELVCLGVGCPCIETPASCPIDCK